MNARQRLKAWLERSGLTQRAAAQLLGMHYTFLNQILQGRRLPSLETAVRIERETGIAPGAWLPTEVGRKEGTVASSNRKRKVA